MLLRRFSHLFIFAAAIAIMSLFGVVWILRLQPASLFFKTPVAVQARRPAHQVRTELTFPLAPQVMVGTPEAYLATPPPPRFTYRNDFPADQSKPLPLYITDTQTTQETRLGDDTGSAVFGIQNEDYLLWHFVCIHPCRTLQEGLYAHIAATRENRLVSNMSTGILSLE